jgi:hypothetical protein
MLGKVLALSTLAAFVLLSALLQSTSPSTIHPVGILVIFILFYLLALGVLTFCLYLIAKLIKRLTPNQGNSEEMSLQQAYYFASVLALAPVMLIGVRSIGRTGPYDVSLIMLFEFIACFYISKRR